jgi:hypothetical protein
LKYELVWTPAAEDDLAAVWMAAEDRSAVTRAAAELE